MVQDEYKHPMPPGSTGNLLKVLQGQPDGRGVSVYEAMAWNVVARLKAGTKTVVEYIVTETREDAKPLKVWGPGTEADATAWAQTQARMYVMIRGGVIEP